MLSKESNKIGFSEGCRSDRLTPMFAENLQPMNATRGRYILENK